MAISIGLVFSPVEKEMATYSSILAWKIPRMEEPGRLPSMGSQKVRHNFTFFLHNVGTLHKIVYSCPIYSKVKTKEQYTLLLLIKILKFHIKKKRKGGAYLVVRWWRLHIPNAGGLGSIPGQGTRFRVNAGGLGLPQLRCGTVK